MYTGNELGKIKVGKFLKRATGSGKILEVVKPFLPGVLSTAADLAIKQLEKKKGGKATPEEIAAITETYPATPQILGLPWYIPVGGVGLLGLLFIMRRK